MSEATMTRRERVARALMGGAGLDYDNCNPSERALWIRHVKAAIAAYEAALAEEGMVIVPREATKGMIDAGRDVGPDAPYGVSETAERWRAMIAAWLAEKG